ncbi:MAG: helix-turn-helix domain-containing protein [Bacteroidota bacterium]
MTEKQENIIKAALQLFATEGYHATSTSKVAKQAKVSEGLIFRHFGNKEGLLQAIVNQGMERAKQLFADIVFETDPREVIRKTLEMPFSIRGEEYEFWRLQFKLKWELKHFDDSKMESMTLALVNAFKKLGYENPEEEAELLKIILDGTSAAILKGVILDKEAILNLQKSKYSV